MPNELVDNLNDPARGDFNNADQQVSGKQAAKKADKQAQKEHSKGDGNNSEPAGYDTRKTHSAKHSEDGKATGAKQ